MIGRIQTAFILALLATTLVAQKPEDRRRALDPTTKVSDDPRRVPAPPEPGGPEGWIVLRGGLLFDATGAAARGATVAIERNRIAKVLPPESTDWPPEARLIDVGGATVLPGLIDLHTHLTYTEPGLSADIALDPHHATLRAVERLRYYIESGITSVRDTASANDAPFRLKEWVAANRLPGPRIFAAGQLITGTGGHGAEGLSPRSEAWGAIREASGPDDWREAVREQFKKGADVIKVASHFSKQELRAAVDEAHALGLKVTCDCETFYVDWAIEAGVDCIEHPLPRTDQAIQRMAEKGIQAVPTLIPYIYIFDQWGGYWGSTSRRFTFSKEANLDMLRRLRRAGVVSGVGTDLILDWFRYLPEPYITELKQFDAAGYSTAEALIAATATGARILDLDEKLGTIEVGKLADILVVRGRPDLNLDDLANVSMVIRDGYIVVEDGQVRIPRHTPVVAPRRAQ